MNKEQLTIVGLAACLGFDMVVHFRNRKRIKKLIGCSTTAVNLMVASDKENDYLRNKLDEHEVPVTEFDRIVFNTLFQDI